MHGPLCRALLELQKQQALKFKTQKIKTNKTTVTEFL
jgi:hypothetical protein